jgi:acyl-CoA thioesterase II
MAKPATLPEQVALQKLAEDHYVTLFNLDKMGIAANRAYGGCTLGVAVNAAYQTVDPTYHCYSIMGNYLGPALTDRGAHCKVRRYRDTRTFASRQVELSQEQDDGSFRPCMILLAEFQVQEPATLLSYSAPPLNKYAGVEDSPTREEWSEKLVNEGKASQQEADAFIRMFELMYRFWEGRSAPESLLSHNLYGMAKHLPTPDDKLPLTSRKSAEYFRSRHPLKTDDVAACSTLDFALRIFTNKVNLNEWHLKEMKTINGAEGRTFGEAHLWDLKGNLVASMTQQSIMRPHKPKPAKAAL